MPEAVQEAVTFMKNAKLQFWNLSIEELFANHVRLVQVCQVRAAWESTEATAVEETTTTMDDRRMTSKNIHNLPGSATGEEALAILKARDEERAAVVDDAFAKKEEQKKKKARDTTRKFFSAPNSSTRSSKVVLKFSGA